MSPSQTRARRRHAPPRWVRWTLASIAALVACVGFGVSTATAHLSLGPHEAVYHVTSDGLVVADLGPLGTLEIDSPLPLGLGVEVVVKEIPSDLSAVDQATTLAALTGDLESYLQFFSSPDVTVGTIARALVADAVRRTLLAAGAVVLAGAGLRLLLGPARRRELAGRVAPRTWELTAGTLVVALVAVTASASGVEAPPRGRPASEVFEGTALEGARITGRLAGVIDTYGGQLVGLYEENQRFYEGARVQLVGAWKAWEIREAVRTSREEVGQSPLRPVPPPDDDGTTPDATPAGDDATPADAATDAPAAPTSPTPSPGQTTPAASPDPEDLVTLLVVADLHCNTGMTPLIREVAERAGVDVVLNAGDTTMNGTAVERVCVDSFATTVPAGARMVVADGNHDSPITSAQEAAHGQVILDGDVVEVAGVRILGDRDALETRVGAGTGVAREVTPLQQSEALAEAACADEQGVDLLLVHTATVGTPALESGCVPFQVSGHSHRRAGPEQVGLGIRYVSASTAGATSGQPTVGPLRGTAEMTLLRFDPEARRFVDWQLVEVRPSGEATVYDRRAVPAVEPPAEVPPDDVDGGDEDQGRGPDDEDGEPQVGTDASATPAP
ncbi:metallophosphoesterase [Isoptericola variabilis]|uniref:Metallophosphoesterase n=1 Tax=Isoptericola variabilis (strain 225) TaxID=743718 RepID=F6FPL0_ISOV2|nr:metallophosphoesterase family protein [Isoptericola variabilis]AEG44742.1 metallophosphoesterase [Isoptericola variabilis 225]TWH32355.1 calcineurin-like phosphoesterase family protein [Isoptericola variabilis J7]